jgi:uncharacterized repeat protein (TIGR01451 family)
MKNLIRTTLFIVAVMQVSFSFASAQSYEDLNDTSFDAPVQTTVSSDNYSGYSYVPFNPSTPISYSDLNNTTFSNAATYFGNETCIGCGTTQPGTGLVPPTDNTCFSGNCGGWVTPTNNICYSGNCGGSSIGINITPGYYPPTCATYGGCGSQTLCSDGSLPINGSCNRTNIIPINNITTCSDGSSPINGSCTRTNVLPATNITQCSDGSTPVNGSCARTNVIPTTVNTLCSDGTPAYNGCVHTNYIPTTNYVPTVTYQTCWDGSRIPVSSVCQAQYKMCANGTSVPVNQTCYISSSPVYIAPAPITFNNVVTSVATQVTNTSARCNGIGLIANNALSNGWFEYGETPNLGRATVSARIGNSNSSPFSNLLTNLKPSTRYYCRAVMQNQYGIVKGEIVGFTTKGKVTTYVKPVTVFKRPVAKTPVKKPEIVCADGSVVSVKNQTSASLINQGQKLVTLSIEKVDGKLASGETVHYKVSYKNLTDTRLTGILVKVTLPSEVLFVSSTAGNYDMDTRTLILNQDTIDPYTEGAIIITASVANDAPIGKTVIANAYVAYTVPGTKTEDEVTAYVIGSIVPVTDMAHQDTGAKKVIGTNTGKSFMPTSLIEWLALLAILFIIFILGRSIYASYKEDSGDGHH